MDNYTAKEVINGQTLYLANNLDVTPTLARFDAVVTDPPYGKRELANYLTINNAKVY